MYTVIGSGFGLYGYLPALVAHLNKKIVLPIDYQNKIKARPELLSLLDKVQWVKDRNTALEIADTVVLAIPPFSQDALVSECLKFKNIRRLVLEKPIASNPVSSTHLHNELIDKRINFTVAYTLACLDWQSDITWSIKTDMSIVLTWDFMAHHFAYELRNWKRVHKQGGGVLRFFGIHIIAMLAMRGYTEVQTITLNGELDGEPEVWKAIFNGEKKPPCYVNMNSRSLTPCFTIRADGGRALLSLKEPFALEKSRGKLDRRVATLAKIIKKLDSVGSSYEDHEWYAMTNMLWHQAEIGI